jgi:hypothetical protein
MEAISEISLTIASLVESAPAKTLPGSVLAVLVKQAYPRFQPCEYGCIKLRDFIKRHVPRVIETGRSGADIVYGMRVQTSDSGPGPDAEQSRSPASHEGIGENLPTLETSIWKTFTSPSGIFRLFGNTQTGELAVVGPNTLAPGAPWVQVPSCSSVALLQMAKDFIDTVTDDLQKQVLSRVLNSPAWWRAFLPAAIQLGLGRAWSSFRRRRILSEFSSILTRLGVPYKLASQRPSAAVLPKTRFTPSFASPSNPSSEALIRRLALGAVQKMSVVELRALNLPLGYVLDQLVNG